MKKFRGEIRNLQYLTGIEKKACKGKFPFHCGDVVLLSKSRI